MSDEFCAICGERLVSLNTRISAEDTRLCIRCHTDFVAHEVDQFVKQLVARYHNPNCVEWVVLQKRRRTGESFGVPEVEEEPVV